MSGILNRLRAWLSASPQHVASTAGPVESAAPVRRAEPPADWQQGGRNDLQAAITRLGYKIADCAWTWDPRPMPGAAKSFAPWGSGGFPGFAAPDETPPPFLEAHLFWHAGNDDVLEVAVIAGRDDRLRWVWQRHVNISTSAWVEVPTPGQAGPDVRLHATGALVLLPPQQ